MANCEWMFGDAATGILGFHGMASMNPLRWSGPVTFDKGIADLEEVLKHGTRPIIVKVPAGVSSKEQSFKTPEEAIDYLKSVDPKRMSLKAAAENAARVVQECEAILEESKMAEQAANADLMKALEASGKAASLKCEWMFADAGSGIGKLGMFFANFNPVRWSGGQTFAKTLADLDGLTKQADESGADHRPIKLRIPPGLSGQEETFENSQSAIARLKTDVEDGGESDLTKLEDAHERAKETLLDAELKLDEAKTMAEEAAAAAAAA
mmetsp:Transcript_34367/g.94680  ORF Transcript_34367/g.94680 Transcript_34367/m.94680 type:complete len:267 (+) Transcript_34367:69-869(+)|eukprot:CAMPEP_0117537914 /NCGR_PEP_ID=MMETSP0784-20121206/42212_1 /TAXON_ID=39447 /ORGANISM="" /LENGTH=266 /DNA_ID=CAMNT_0005334519 /DNA_START=66 /DNA_END=866 /DNA_ORIENTATION=+